MCSFLLNCTVLPSCRGVNQQPLDCRSGDVFIINYLSQRKQHFLVLTLTLESTLHAVLLRPQQPSSWRDCERVRTGGKQVISQGFSSYFVKFEICQELYVIFFFYTKCNSVSVIKILGYTTSSSTSLLFIRWLCLSLEAGWLRVFLNKFHLVSLVLCVQVSLCRTSHGWKHLLEALRHALIVRAILTQVILSSEIRYVKGKDCSFGWWVTFQPLQSYYIYIA